MQIFTFSDLSDICIQSFLQVIHTTTNQSTDNTKLHHREVLHKGIYISLDF